jgi:predicted secreted protein
LGFSADGRYFAFEQYGEEDGSGAVYSEIAVIDVSSDRFVAGTPVSGNSREDAMMKAAAILQQLGVRRSGDEIGVVALSRPHDVIVPKDVNRLIEDAVVEMSPAPRIFGTGARVTLQVAEVEATQCRDRSFEDSVKGFALALDRPGRGPEILHRDVAIPRSRGCPDRYGLAAAYAMRMPDGATALAVLVQYFYVAFEGHNRRFLAVTARIPRDGATQ